ERQQDAASRRWSMRIANVRSRLVFAVSLCIVSLALLAPLTANAQVTVSQVRVTIANSVKTAVYCDTTVAGCNQIWNLGGGVALTPTQTLVLTQNGSFAGVGGDFDVSDLATPTGVSVCNAATPCTVTVELNTGSGLLPAYGPSNAPVPLNNFNNDPGGELHQ